ncbi:hypothetical protein [Brevibacillus sp. MS2.2]|nr:hypothetical protein [Brevibacillus sp. MS2.2]NRR20040.1 hypothetical protein [Brevibacillus sp. MS2.2]
MAKRWMKMIATQICDNRTIMIEMKELQKTAEQSAVFYMDTGYYVI